MPKIAIVHDYFIQEGGAEKVADELQRMFPDAQMFTTVSRRPENGNGRATKTSWMQTLPVNAKTHRHFFLLYPLAVESLDLTDYDIIISSTSGYAKGIRKREDAVHICYCHTPMRWVWFFDHYSQREQFGKIKNVILPYFLNILRMWDIRASKRPDFYIANSGFVAKRIKRLYNREAIVIPPPIDVGRFSTSDSVKDFYLILSRLVSYKRIDLAIEACEKLGRKLVIIGDGPARDKLEQSAGDNIIFMGRQSDEVVNKYASECRALIFPGEEDFGMTPLEINAAGRPVIAFRSGGAKETIIKGKTGMFFDEQTPECLIDAITSFEELKWNTGTLRDHALTFDRSVFEERMVSFVNMVSASRLESAETYRPRGVQPALEKELV